MKTSYKILDIAVIEPEESCRMILEYFDTLVKGEAVILEHDQDPVYLYHHLMEVRAEPFSWERLEDGPPRWQVRITKSAINEGALPIGQIATKDYLKAEVFQRLGIPYCCAGKKPLKEACEEAGIQEDILEQIYAEASRQKAKEVYAFDEWEIGFLADYILHTHHDFVRQNIQHILDLSASVALEQQGGDPAIGMLDERLNSFLASLVDHMQVEEQIVFPWIKKLAVRKKKNKRLSESMPTGIDVTIQKLEKEHQQAGKDLKSLRKLTRNYRLPANASEAATHLFAKLLELENDLVQHIHLENNLLFPKAVALEKELVGHHPHVFIKQIFPAY